MKLIKYRNKDIVLDFVPSVLEEYKKSPFQYFLFVIDTSIPTQGDDPNALEYRVLERDPIYSYRFTHGEVTKDGEIYKHGTRDTPGSLKELFITVREYKIMVKQNPKLQFCAVRVDPPNRVYIVTKDLIERTDQDAALFGTPSQQMHIIEDIANYGKTHW